MNVVNDGPTGERPTGCQVINQEATVDLSQVKGPNSRAENGDPTHKWHMYSVGESMKAST